MFDVFQLQKLLSEHASPPGSEYKDIALILAELAAPYVDEVYTDAMGNVIAHKKGQGGKRIMYAAHMDAIGFMVNFIDEQGFLRFENIGGNTAINLVNLRLRFANGCRGIIRVRKEAEHLKKPMGDLKMSDLFIDIGAGSREEAASLVSLGDIALFDSRTVKVAGNNIMTSYADDLVGCIVLLLTMEQIDHCKNELYFVFATQEEVGRRGSRTAAFAIDPDIGFACDVDGEGDSPRKNEVPMALYIGKGPALKIKDGSVIGTGQLNEKMRALAKENGIPWQEEVLPVGGTDTSRIQSTRGGVPATAVSIPTHNIHTPCEIYNIDDVKNAARLFALAAHAEY